MFSLIKNLPSFAVGIRAQGEVTQDDYSKVLVPAIREVLKEHTGINLLMVLETELTNFTAGGWMEDIKVNVSYFFKWNKIAMVSINETMDKISATFNIIAPGEVKSFTIEDIEKATEWISAVD